MKTLFKVAAVVLVMGLSQGANAAVTPVDLGELNDDGASFSSVIVAKNALFTHEYDFTLSSN